ncbi:hypothetical protein BALAC2494_02063 [Bifidobacterium animalis subsp. lactis CNCM I-2494]|uniref:Uncharacterized protein n=1 Tax=Bifidobacterium animalis subsp. lactis CNCM I-2494 TaxID=1042403 RepID=A0A806FZJ4_BIFAN|nr:hypothetical protein BALAC2494_02063 [Bifidobacterium animalis subsp. lactis CNCM I-2494]
MSESLVIGESLMVVMGLLLYLTNGRIGRFMLYVWRG